MGLQDRLATLRGNAEGPWVDRLAPYAPMAVSVLLVVGIAGQAASIVWTALAPRVAPAVDPATLPAQRQSSPVDVGAILSGRLFGGTAAVDPGSVAATSQNLVLAGTIAVRDPEKGWAILGDSAQNAKVYSTGATLPGGARLKAVYQDRVILDLNGRLESLMLPRLSGGTGPVQIPTARPTSAPDGGSLAARIQQLTTDQPGLLGDIMRPQPVFSGGQQRGYRVYPGRNRQQFAKLGLQPGDLITAVNGAPLDDPARGMDMLRNLSAGDRVTVTVERNGQSQQLTIDASKIVSDLSSQPPSPGVNTPDPSE